MKNIFLIPTDKESRLWRDLDSNKLRFDNLSHSNSNECTKCSHEYVYITSDEEGIYDKDYYLYEGSVFQARPRDEGNFKNKVILTTDQDLIKDGVQKIDDEFLQFFVKNPSCEEVEIVEGDFINGKYTFGKYHIRRMYFADEPKQESKETLEEAFEKFMETNFCGQLTKGFVLGAMKFGAKWQQKRSYSEEEVIVMINEIVEKHCTYFEQKHKDTVKLGWFEQFKKK